MPRLSFLNACLSSKKERRGNMEAARNYGKLLALFCISQNAYFGEEAGYKLTDKSKVLKKYQNMVLNHPTKFFMEKVKVIYDVYIHRLRSLKKFNWANILERHMDELVKNIQNMDKQRFSEVEEGVELLRSFVENLDAIKEEMFQKKEVKEDF
jgi:hypothetical protein